MERDTLNDTTRAAEDSPAPPKYRGRPLTYADDDATDFDLAVRFARALAPMYRGDSEIESEVAFALGVLARAGDASSGIDDATLGQFVAHQPDAVALHMGLIAAEAVRDAADDPRLVGDSAETSYLIGARDAIYDLTKKLVATRLELEKATADQAELAELRKESALLSVLEAEALRDPIYLHNGTEEALANRKHARGLGFGPAFGRTLREAIAPFLAPAARMIREES